MPPPPTPNPDPLTWTALAALRARAAEQREPSPLLVDPAAADWLDELPHDTGRFARAAATQVAVCARARQFDAWVSDWLTRHRDGLVIELGVGVSTRHARLGLGPDAYLGVDRPAVAAMRSSLAPGFTTLELDLNADLNKTAAAHDDSPTPTQVLERAAAGRPVCFVAEGLLMYLRRAQVDRLLRQLAAAFPGATLCFDAYAPPARLLAPFHDSLRHTRQRLRSTFVGCPNLNLTESRILRDFPDAHARLPRPHRFSGVHKLYAMHLAQLSTP